MKTAKFNRMLAEVRNLSNAQKIALAEAMFGNCYEEDNYGQVMIYTDLVERSVSCDANGFINKVSYRKMKPSDAW